MKRISICLLTCFTFLLWANVLLANPLNLSTFTADVGVSESGGIVNFTEDINSYGIYFYNDNFFVDPNATALTFDYLLELGPDNEDYLIVQIDSIYEFEIGDWNSSDVDTQILSGTGSIDMTPFQGSYISLAFGLEANDWYADTIATVSNIDLQIASIPVPETGSIILLGIGIAGLFGIGRRKILKNL
ncbi:hypothetical protein [Desulfobacterium sp. N47]|uniref:PEP-CTERM protein-sorting domain-containing protein n=1 Tax=uncultured Desulfobacterium sp. TaxID=201089 RepID=E1YI24_9BACT|nr:unknown protein [uncultured Desulfobacterium sp.]